MTFWGTFYRYFTSMMFCNVINTIILIKINQRGMTIYGQEAHKGGGCSMLFLGTFYRYFTSMMFRNVINTKNNQN